MSGKGLKLTSRVGKAAPKEIKEVVAALQKPVDSVEPAGSAAVVSFLGAKKAKPVVAATSAAAPSLPKPKPAALAAPKPAAVPKPLRAAPAAPLTPFEELADAEADEEIAAPEPKAVMPTKFKPKQRRSEFTDILDAIKQEEAADPYEEAEPTPYVPETRRAFLGFVQERYSPFILDPSKVTEPGEKYPYQKFIREYMRMASPYRGILVYHGLGSGKTCTAIATSEALFSTAKRKIIVMTPFSLRKNFLEEISACGFRHFRLQNHWIKLPKDRVEIHMFALEILNLSARYLESVSGVWVPDFSKEPNFNDLSEDDRAEIRKQILTSLEYNSEKKTGRIHFISYNGITKKRLMDIACNDPTFFDNSVIIVDEIHNLIRLMQGKIDPFLITLEQKQDPTGATMVVAKKGKARAVQVEPVSMDAWKPTQCGAPAETKIKYSRGYLFYRLLLQAKGSKLIGLSGTPLINFPEELGILMNVLHGYIPYVDATLKESGADTIKAATNLLRESPYVDFHEVKAVNTREGGATGVVTGVRFTLLPYGVRKLPVGADGKEQGVERIPMDEEIPPVAEILSGLEEEFSAAGLTFEKSLAVQAVPLLPPTGEEFRMSFMNEFTGISVAERTKMTEDEMKTKEEQMIKSSLDSPLKPKADIVLAKRISGLVSYYKGSRADLMPRVKVDRVVRVPMSEYSQMIYMRVRSEEITKEMKPKKDTGGLSGIWAEIYNVGTKAVSSNYKMASRQACNFAFPEGITRPKPRTRQEQVAEAEAGTGGKEDIYEAAPEGDAAEKGEVFPEIEETAAAAVDDVGDEELAAEEDREDREELVEDAGEGIVTDGATTDEVAATSGGGWDEDEYGGGKEDDEEAAPAPAPITSKKFVSKKGLVAPAPAAVPVAEAAPVAEAPVDADATAVAAAAADADATAVTEPKPEMKDIKKAYQEAILKAKQALRANAAKLFSSAGLPKYSPKYAAMLQNIADLPGSSLVYSQFLDLEGIGIFRMAMDANGYTSVQIRAIEGGYEFDEKTLASFAKPGALRYMTFSGAEDPTIRGYLLNIFNAKFDKLPEGLREPIVKAGLENNHKGEICRVFCITRAGAEGLSLKCVRGVHIMEPYWNDVLIRQVKGRAIRIGSHLELPEEERDVSIFTYLSVFSKEAQAEKRSDSEIRIDETIRGKDAVKREEAESFGIPKDMIVGTQYVMTTDERLYSVALRKKAVTDNLERLMKAAAVDCKLNEKENLDGTYSCFEIKGDIGSFMYDPILSVDISKTQAQQIAAKPAVAAAVPPEPKPEMKKLKGALETFAESLGVAASAISLKEFRGKRYYFQKRDKDFFMYEATQADATQNTTPTMVAGINPKTGGPAVPVLPYEEWRAKDAAPKDAATE